jgi:hypothetical protein
MEAVSPTKVQVYAQSDVPLVPSLYLQFPILTRYSQILKRKRTNFTYKYTSIFFLFFFCLSKEKYLALMKIKFKRDSC